MLGPICWPEVRLRSQGGGLGIRVGVTFLLKKLGKLKWYCDRKMHIAIESILPLTATPVQGSTYTPLMVWILLRSYLGFHIWLSVWKPTLACFGGNKKLLKSHLVTKYPMTNRIPDAGNKTVTILRTVTNRFPGMAINHPQCSKGKHHRELSQDTHK